MKTDIRVVGVGGGGGNAVENMIKSNAKDIQFIVLNTDAQALELSKAHAKVQLGTKLTRGLGAGGDPEIGHRAAIESYNDISQALKGADMVFITAGMGGGTGTGGASVVAEIVKNQGALTVGIVTYPFLFEGNRRKRYAEKGIEELKKYLDILISIPNDKLLATCDKETPILKTFQETNNILLQAVKGISDLISLKGLINLDFSDVKTILSNKGTAVMGMGEARGKNRAIEAVHQAVSSPLLENISIEGAKGLIINVTGGLNLSLNEVNTATSLLTGIIDKEADIIVGAAIDENLGDILKVTAIMTGFEISNKAENILSERLKYLVKEKSLEQEKISEMPMSKMKNTPENTKEQNNEAEMSIKEILISKANQYKASRIKESKKENVSEEQMDMEWEMVDSEYEGVSPFESELEFSEKDIDS